MTEGVKRRSDIEGKDNSSEDKGNYKVVHIGDMVYNSMRMWQGANGISAYDGIVSPAYTVLTPKVKIANGFFGALFKSHRSISEFCRHSQGMTSDTWNLKYPQIEKIRVSIPGFREQQKISDFLSEIEIRIEKQRNLVEHLKKYKRGLIRSMFSDISSWMEYSISNVGTVITGNTPPTQNPDNYMGDRLFCAPGDLGHSKYIVSTEKNISETALNKNRKIPKGSILVTCIGSTIGKMGIAGEEMLTNQQINSVIVSKGHCNEFVYYALEYYFPQFLSHVGKQAVPILSKGQFENLSIYLPSIEVQKKYSSMLTSFDIKIEKAMELLHHLQNYKSGLLQQLFI